MRNGSLDRVRTLEMPEGERPPETCQKHICQVSHWVWLLSAVTGSSGGRFLKGPLAIQERNQDENVWDLSTAST